MSTDHLFALPSDSFVTTSDDCYTPRWVFDAMGLEFDLDVASPAGGPWHVPTKAYYTAEDDGLMQPWSGLIWCNPPFSRFRAWAEKWAEHDTGVLMGAVQPENRFPVIAFAGADAVAFISCAFSVPNGGPPVRLRQQIFVAFRGIGTRPAERLAAADKFGAVLYGRPAA